MHLKILTNTIPQPLKTTMGSSDEEMLDLYNDSDPDNDNDDDAQYEEDDDNDDAQYEEDDDNDDIRDHIRLRPQKTYTALTEDDIRHRQHEDISHVSAALSISEIESTQLLCHYKWNVPLILDKWFANEGKVRATVGLPTTSYQPKDQKEAICGICFDSLPCHLIYPTICGHPYCIFCWKGYITTSINNGPGCLFLRCPEPSCHDAVGRDMINKLASEGQKHKYSQYFLRTYVEGKTGIKWCPSPGCENAVEIEPDSSVYDVSCLCSFAFCWNCTEDAHRPVDCNTVSKWIFKNNSEAENVQWLLVNSKPCPKCKNPIEKNQGCMHMTCISPCKFEFCWLCLGPWSEHNARTGGHYACNSYETEKQKGLHSEEETRREMGKRALERYTHYYERWASNEKSRQKAMQDLHTTQTVNIQQISNREKLPETQLEFIIEAWKQIIECRRVLKWTYAYGYYLPEHEDAKKQFFEYLQGLAENALERLHLCAEKELSDDFLTKYEGNMPANDFSAFHIKLIDLTKVTRMFFENLVRALENGLSDVDSQAVCNTAAATATKKDAAL